MKVQAFFSPLSLPDLLHTAYLSPQMAYNQSFIGKNSEFRRGKLLVSSVGNSESLTPKLTVCYRETLFKTC